MSDLEDLLVRTLHDERRAPHVTPGTTHAALRRSQRLLMQRRLGLGALALASVAAIAGATMLVDDSSAPDGKAPSYDASVSAQPRTS